MLWFNFIRGLIFLPSRISELGTRIEKDRIEAERRKAEAARIAQLKITNPTAYMLYRLFEPIAMLAGLVIGLMPIGILIAIIAIAIHTKSDKPYWIAGGVIASILVLLIVVGFAFSAWVALSAMKKHDDKGEK